MASLTFNPVEVIFLTVLIVSAVVAVRILFVLSSRKHRHRYSRVIRADFILGLVLGFLLPWNEPIGVGIAALLSIVFVSMSVYYLLRIRFAYTFPRTLWPTRETFRDWFLHFSIITGVIGIITTLLSIVLPPFLALSLGSIVPLSFDGLSVLSALLEFSIPIPHYNVIYAILHRRLSEKSSNTDLVEANDIDWVVANGELARAEILDALEILVQQGLAERHKENFGSRLNYILTMHGVELLEYDYKEIVARLSNDRERIEAAVRALEKSAMEPRWRRRVHSQIRDRLARVSEEYAVLVDEAWTESIRQRLALL